MSASVRWVLLVIELKASTSVECDCFDSDSLQFALIHFSKSSASKGESIVFCGVNEAFVSADIKAKIQKEILSSNESPTSAASWCNLKV